MNICLLRTYLCIKGIFAFKEISAFKRISEFVRISSNVSLNPSFYSVSLGLPFSLHLSMSLYCVSFLCTFEYSSISRDALRTPECISSQPKPPGLIALSMAAAYSGRIIFNAIQLHLIPFDTQFRQSSERREWKRVKSNNLRNRWANRRTIIYFL